MTESIDAKVARLMEHVFHMRLGPEERIKFEVALRTELAVQGEPVAWMFVHNSGNGGRHYTFHTQSDYLTAYRDTCLEEVRIPHTTPQPASHWTPVEIAEAKKRAAQYDDWFTGNAAPQPAIPSAQEFCNVNENGWIPPPAWIAGWEACRHKFSQPASQAERDIPVVVYFDPVTGALSHARLPTYVPLVRMSDALAAIKGSTTPPSPIGGEVTDAEIAGALFDFMGMLTSQDEKTQFSSTDNASPAVEQIRKFALKRGLSLENADVSGWRNRLAATSAKPADHIADAGKMVQPAEPLTDERIDELLDSPCMAQFPTDAPIAYDRAIFRLAERAHGIKPKDAG